MPQIIAACCKLLYTVTDYSFQGRLQIVYLMVGISVSSSLDFFPIKGMEGGVFGSKSN
jgi:hypothetical protein